MRPRIALGVSIGTLLVAGATIAAIVVGQRLTAAPDDARLRMTTLTSGAVDIGHVDQGKAGPPLPADRDLTSSAFGVPIEFRVRGSRGGVTIGEFCVRGADRSMITLAHILSCQDDVRFILPADVACPVTGLDRSPDAVAEAILRRPSLTARDRGQIAPGENVPSGLFVGPMTGRVIDIVAARHPVDAASGGETDDRCRLLLGQSDDRSSDGLAVPAVSAASVDIAADITERLILVDAHGALVVMRASTASQPGFETIEHMLEQLYAIRFP